MQKVKLISMFVVILCAVTFSQAFPIVDKEVGSVQSIQYPYDNNPDIIRVKFTDVIPCYIYKTTVGSEAGFNRVLSLLLWAKSNGQVIKIKAISNAYDGWAIDKVEVY